MGRFALGRVLFEGRLDRDTDQDTAVKAAYNKLTLLLSFPASLPKSLPVEEKRSEEKVI